MMDFHYTAGVILFAASALGCLLPFQRVVDVAPVRPLSTGIVFAVAMCHLLPDASEILDTEGITDWFMKTTGLEGSVGSDGLYDVLPVAETLMCLGVFIMLVIDQCIPCPHHQVLSMREFNAPSKAERAKLVPTAENGDCNGCDTHHTYESTCDHDHISDGRAPPKLANAKVYATEMAIAIHSVIIGFTMGVDPDTESLVGFTVAMVFHQLFEGVALSMIALQGDLGAGALCLMVLMFASSLPLGILVGLGTYRAAAGDGDGGGDGLDLTEIFFQGVPNAVAAGMLLHIGFELMMEDFNHRTGKFPAGKLALAFLGGSVVCFLAVWA